MDLPQEEFDLANGQEASNVAGLRNYEERYGVEEDMERAKEREEAQRRAAELEMEKQLEAERAR